MKSLFRAMHRREDDGASAVEYGLLVALIAAVIVVAVFSFGDIVKQTFNKTCTSFTSPGPISGSCDS